MLLCTVRDCRAPLVLEDRRYVCAKGPGLAGCGRTAVLSEPVEELIAEAVLYRLDTPELAAVLAGAAREDAETAAAQDSLAADQSQLNELATAYGEIGFCACVSTRGKAPPSP